MNKQELQQKCKDILKEIMDLKEELNYSSDNKMFEEVFVEYKDSEEWDNEKALQRKFKEQFKKVFQRIGKEQRLSDQTLKNLERFRKALYRTDTYKKSDYSDDSILPNDRIKLKKASEELEQALKLKYDTEE